MLPTFRIIEQSKKSRARVGELRTAHGVVATPTFMTIATRGAVKTLAAEDMKELGAQIILSNTYHLFVRPGMEVIKKAGGLHKFMDWDRPILTDSGGYQVFSLAQKYRGGRPSPQSSPIKGEEGKRSPSPRVGEGGGEGVDYDVRITPDGAEFIDRKSGRKDLFTPERVLEIQRDFGVDIAMVLDVCAPYPVSKKGAREAMEMTTEWARRSKPWCEHNSPQPSLNLREGDRLKPPLKIRGGRGSYEQLLFGIIQGSIYKDLRQQSAREIVALNFDGYAIGGVAVGETARQKRQVVGWVIPHLPEDKPRYLMGLGQPEEIVAAVRAGIDMFDCVLPTRNARHGNLYVWNGAPPLTPPQRGGEANRSPLLFKEGIKGWLWRGGVRARNFYDTMHITNEKYRADFKPPDPFCDCFTCIHHSRAYLRHLFKVAEPLAARLATIHNVRFYLNLMEVLRIQIAQGTL